MLPLRAPLGDTTSDVLRKNQSTVHSVHIIILERPIDAKPLPLTSSHHYQKFFMTTSGLFDGVVDFLGSDLLYGIGKTWR